MGSTIGKNRSHLVEQVEYAGENEELEYDVRSFAHHTTHLTTAVLRRGVEMSML